MNTEIEIKENQDERAVNALMTRHKAASNRRENWERLWQECYDYTLPQRGDFEFDHRPGAARSKSFRARAFPFRARGRARVPGGRLPRTVDTVFVSAVPYWRRGKRGATSCNGVLIIVMDFAAVC